MYTQSSAHYQPLPHLDEFEGSRCRRSIFNDLWMRIGLFVSVTSILCNIIAVLKLHQHFRSGTIVQDNCSSQYAGLSRKLPRPFTVVGQENITPDEEWDSISADTGGVALTDDYVSQMGLPRAQRWPWDSDKGIYYLHGHHNLHCVKTLHTSILEYRARTLQSQHSLHVDHCLTVLREDILCNADDTPRWTGGDYEQPGSGQGQMRMCRDWSELDRWANEHSACFGTPVVGDEADESKLSAYMLCPDGSRPWEGKG